MITYLLMSFIVLELLIIIFLFFAKDHSEGLRNEELINKLESIFDKMTKELSKNLVQNQQKNDKSHDKLMYSNTEIKKTLSELLQILGGIKK